MSGGREPRLVGALGGLAAYARRRLPAVRPVWPPALVAVLVWVGVVRLFWIWFLTRYHPNTLPLRNIGDATAFWQIWHGAGALGVTVQGWFMIVNLLLVLYLWADLRGRPRGSFGARCLQLATYGGAAALLIGLQQSLLRASLIEPVFRVIRLPLVATP